MSYGCKYTTLFRHRPGETQIYVQEIPSAPQVYAPPPTKDIHSSAIYVSTMSDYLPAEERLHTCV